jgi:hypothetical protein
MLGVLIWVWFFQVSDRVRATYGPMTPGPLGPRHALSIGLAAGTIVCVSSVAIAESRMQTWTAFTSGDGRYQVDAPGQAQQSTLDGGGSQVVFENDTRRFEIRVIPAAQRNEDAQLYLARVRALAIIDVKGNMETSTTSPVLLEGHPGVEFTATFPGKGPGILLGRAYTTGSETFLLLVTGLQGGRTASEAEKFFQSFQIRR